MEIRLIIFIKDIIYEEFTSSSNEVKYVTVLSYRTNFSFISFHAFFVILNHLNHQIFIHSILLIESFQNDESFPLYYKWLNYYYYYYLAN